MFTMPRTLADATTIELLNKVLQKSIPEFNQTLEDRHTYIEDGHIVKWSCSFSKAPEKSVIRECSEKEVAIWEAYVKLVRALHQEEK